MMKKKQSLELAPSDDVNKTSNSKSKIGADVKVSILTLSFNIHAKQNDLDKAVETVFKEPKEAKELRILLLPGAQLRWLEKGDVTTYFKKLSKTKDMYVVAECACDDEDRKYCVFDPNKKGVVGKVCQIFTSGKDSWEVYDDVKKSGLDLLEERCQKPSGRIFSLGGVKVGLLVCGENNVLTAGFGIKL